MIVGGGKTDFFLEKIAAKMRIGPQGA